MITPITIEGNLTADPRITPRGDGSVANFTVASNDSKYNQQEHRYETTATVFWDISAWGQLADSVMNNLKKGSRVIITGKPHQYTSQNQQGVKVQRFSINANNIAISIR